MYSCIFACDAVNLMVSCSLLVFMQKNIFSVKKNHKKLLQAECFLGSDINQIVRWLGHCLRPHLGKLTVLFQTTSSI